MQVMDMLKVARVVRAAGGVQGRVKLQKLVYILAEMGFDLPFDDFSIWRHGPYSEDLAGVVDALQSVGVLQENKTDTGVGDAIRYDYVLDTAYEELVCDKVRIEEPQGRHLDDVAGQLADEDGTTLEVAATLVYLEKEEAFSGEALEQELRKLKGHLAGRFDEARKLVEQFF